jgi:hypothetical protein
VAGQRDRVESEEVEERQGREERERKSKREREIRVHREQEELAVVKRFTFGGHNCKLTFQRILAAAGCGPV